MTIKISIECDGLDCCSSIDVDSCDTPDITMQYRGWEQDPNYGWQQYCPTCWIKVKKELGLDNAE